PALGVEVDVGVGVVHPAGRHGLGAGGDALIALDYVVGGRGAARDGVGAQVEVVEGAELLEEDLGGPDQVLGAGFDRDPGLRAVGVVVPQPTGPRIGGRLARWDRGAARPGRG